MKRSSRTLVICNGEPPSRRLGRSLARHADLIVAADGGGNTARMLGIRPDIIIGDFDSISPATRRHFKHSLFLQIKSQENTDLEKTLDFLTTRGRSDVVIVGATGGRLDFTLANLSVFWNYTSNLDITFRGDGWRAVSVGRALSMKAPVGSTVSLIPFGNCEGVTSRGLRYLLRNSPMRVGTIGASNVVTSSPFTVRIRKGRMLLLLLEKRRPVSTW